MENRRDFIKKAALLTGSFGLFNSLPGSIQAALAIEPAAGSTFYDAEHIVLLMQENRSFDHSFGTLKGVRGFNDPRAIQLPNKNLVWLQQNKEGKTYAPFRLDLQNSNAAWTRDLPHSWENQSAARNKGKHDNWLEAKRSGVKEQRDIPLTLGYYSRADIPFYYAFADAFTICDQHFCSSITGTTTNRHFFWTGKCVPKKGEKPLVRNSDIYFNQLAHWKTFPERLEENNISWRVYQNEVSIQNALEGEREPWLGNFTDNNLEWFAQYNIRFKKSHTDFLKIRVTQLPAEIAELETQIKNTKAADSQKLQKNLKNKIQQLESYQSALKTYSAENFAALSNFDKALVTKAFQTNEGDPHYHEIETVSMDDQGTSKDITVPKGDVLYQFREDVKSGKLPTVSWLVAPQNFSDHPSAPMYGAWYVSEVLNILTQNPEVWKKTIFILNYDENDGYFDHIPPFVAPNPNDPASGRTSADLDYSDEYVTREQEIAAGVSEQSATEGPVGLGYRVPLVIASPWSKGGWVNSEVCDITSTIQFMETFLNKKYNKQIFESNISSWRRGITGDLTSAFRPQTNKSTSSPDFLDRNEQILRIDKSKSLDYPKNHHALSSSEIETANRSPATSPFLPKQESGIKESSALAYELYVDAEMTASKIKLRFNAGKNIFKDNALGSPFNVYSGPSYNDGVSYWPFATSAGNQVDFEWNLADFKDNYDLRVYGPNGFLRTFKGNQSSQLLDVTCEYELDKKGIPTGNINLRIKNTDANKTRPVIVSAQIYQQLQEKISLKPNQEKIISINGKKSFNWYEVKVLLADDPNFERGFAGRAETGTSSMTDPQMGRVI
ncbi:MULTISPECIES: phosphocholine-specific phospholipase C [unclassified Sphingobacterium]|uniref:phosphocholine-specific phospholipase C n=1 Tax=unclassified Sphingobacterium TaxID=2609468 RepID=UPI0025FEA830|nr:MULTISPECIES: phospholipase C, phosphocholine-specific [unclassified Sphingobacterium]